MPSPKAPLIELDHAILQAMVATHGLAGMLSALSNALDWMTPSPSEKDLQTAAFLFNRLIAVATTLDAHADYEPENP